MALVHRNGRPYLYRSVRRGGRVTSEYMGGGIDAQLIAALEDDEQLWKRFDREQAPTSWPRELETAATKP